MKDRERRCDNYVSTSKNKRIQLKKDSDKDVNIINKEQPCLISAFTNDYVKTNEENSSPSLID